MTAANKDSVAEAAADEQRGEYEDDESSPPFGCEPCGWRRQGIAFMRSFHCARVNLALRDAARGLDAIAFGSSATFSELDRSRERSRRAAVNAVAFRPLTEAA